MFTCQTNYEAAQRRVDAFWNHEEADRPLVSIRFPKAGAASFPAKRHDLYQDYWLDIDFRVEEMAFHMENTVFYADAMPVAFPDMGPEIFSAWAGCPYSFGATTAWSEPCLHDWEWDSPKAVADREHPLFKTVEVFTRRLLERASDRFIVGLTDFHPGGDHSAALRDPARLAVDLLENPGWVKEKLWSSYDEYFPMYDHFVKIIKDAGQPISTWLPLTSGTSMYVPSNDFSCMISTPMFEEFFLDGLIAECRHYGHSIYHLDGPGALRHLDTILSIPELNAVQWVPGAGHEDVSQWIQVYKRVLAAGKSMQILSVRPGDLPLLMENLPARGVFLFMTDVSDEATAREVMRVIEGWR